MLQEHAKTTRASNKEVFLAYQRVIYAAIEAADPNRENFFTGQFQMPEWGQRLPMGWDYVPRVEIPGVLIHRCTEVPEDGRQAA